VITKDIHWVKMIHDILGKSPEGAEFMNEMKVNIFEDQIFVFTPK
jgi:(p)ppGpp synthase/HD superfamily hydrolase